VVIKHQRHHPWARLHLEETAPMRSKFRSLRWIVASTLSGLLLAGSAAAVPISMDPGAVTVSGLGNDFTLALDSGDTSDNRLNFSIAGGGGWGATGFAPSMGLAAMIFHGVSVLSAGEISDPDHVINGISIPEMGTVAALLIDGFSPSSASFFVETSATPTIATIYGLSLGDIGQIACIGDVFGNILDSKTVRFSAPGSQVPEPTAALVFAVGFLVVQAGCRRRY
jgi:hypothetical protein